MLFNLHILKSAHLKLDRTTEQVLHAAVFYMHDITVYSAISFRCNSSCFLGLFFWEWHRAQDVVRYTIHLTHVE